MKRIIVAILVCLIVAFSFSATIGAPKMLIGVSFATLESEFWQALLKTINDTANKLGADTTSVEAAHNIAKQISQMEDLIAKKVNAIILNAVDAEAIVPIVNKAVEKGITVVTIDRAISPNANFACYVGTDNALAGRMSAKYIAEALGGKGEVAILNGPPATLVARHRYQGFVDGLAAFPNIKIVAEKWGSSDRAVNMTLMEDIITRFPNVKAVLCFSDGNALGAADAIIARGKLGSIIVGSIDGMAEVAQLMIQGKTPIKVSVAQDPSMMARYAAQVAYEAASGMRVPNTIATWVQNITAENAAAYLKSIQ